MPEVRVVQHPTRWSIIELHLPSSSSTAGTSSSEHQLDDGAQQTRSAAVRHEDEPIHPQHRHHPVTTRMRSTIPGSTGRSVSVPRSSTAVPPSTTSTTAAPRRSVTNAGSMTRRKKTVPSSSLHSHNKISNNYSRVV